MQASADYQILRDQSWTLWVDPQRWNPDFWHALRQTVERQQPSRHPQITRLDDGSYLKTFFSASWGGMFKDVVRQSKARRAQQMAAAVTAAGLHAPVTIAAGEKRDRRLLVCSFLLTLPVAGVSLVDFLRGYHENKTTIPFEKKHRALRQLARVIRRFHELGFVHGDLVPTNIFVVQRDTHDLVFYFMDNDRTRIYPRLLPQPLWRRNLVQLNRMPLPGISLQDRMRFLRAYLGAGFESRRAASLARWLEKKTRKRRRECDAVESSGSFRGLMRWREEAA